MAMSIRHPGAPGNRPEGGAEHSDEHRHAGGEGGDGEARRGPGAGEGPPAWHEQARRFLRPHRAKLAVTLAASAVSMGALAAVPVIQRSVLDDAILAQHHVLAPLLIALAGIGVLRFATSLVRRFVGGRVSYDVQLDVRNALYQHLMGLDMSVHDGLQTGQLVSRANSDLGLIQQILAWAPMVMGSLLQAVLSLVVMAVLNVPLFFVALVVPVATYWSSRSLRSTVFPSSWDAQQKEADLTTVVEESTTGVRVVKAFGREQGQLERFVGGARQLYGSRLRNIRLRARMTAQLQSIPSFGQLGVLALGGWFAMHGTISIGTFVAFATYMTQLAAPARMLAGILTVGQQARAGVERVTEIFELRPNLTDTPGARPLPPATGALAFDQVTLAYEDGRQVLSGVDLHVEPGEALAVIGPSGSGKSSLCALVARLYDPAAGTVSIDGHDLRQVTLASLRSQVGMVFEESFLFRASITENVRFGRPDATDDQVARACEVAQAAGFIAGLPDGYDTVVGEGGITLSGGQRQRIALARTLLTEPQVLVLDDATSAIDPHTEAVIVAALRQLPQCPTVLVTSQRPSVLGLVDRVAVLAGGHLVDEGRPAEVAQRSAWMRTFMDIGGDGAQRSDPDGHSADGGPDGNGRSRAGDDARDGTVTARAGAGAWGWGTMSRGGAGWGRGAGAGGGGGWVAMLGAPPKAMADRIAALPPAADTADVDVERQIDARGPLELRRFVRPWRWALGVGFALVALDALSGLASPLLIRSGIDGGVERHSVLVLAVVSGAFLGITLLSWWVQWAETVQTGRTGESMLLGLRVRLFAHLQRLGVDFYERELAGRIVTRMTNDVQTLSQLLQNGMVNALVSLLSFVGIAIALFVMNVHLALVAVAVIPVLVVATVIYRYRASRAYDRQREQVAAVNAHLQESVSGVRVMQMLGRQQAGLDTFEAIGLEYRRASLSALSVQATYIALSDLLATVSTVLVLWVGAGLVERHTLAVGALVAFLLYVTQLFSPVQQLAQVFDSYQRALAGMRKISSVLADEPSVTSPPGARRLPRLRGEVHFAAVSFRYPGATRDAVHGIELAVPAGQHVALVGETGAGKSTLVKLLARFYDPTTGAVIVDGADLRTVDLASYRSQLGYVPQESFLFTASIRDNIAFGRPEATDDEVRAAARAVGADLAIESLAGAYHHVVSERGHSLSAGERQLVCLARALLVDPAILLLDEATANLDPATEAQVQAAMDVVSGCRTTFLIAHRLSTARAMDRIVVVGDGRIAEDGTHEQLAEAGGWYQRSWEATMAAGGSPPPVRV